MPDHSLLDNAISGLAFSRVCVCVWGGGGVGGMGLECSVERMREMFSRDEGQALICRRTSCDTRSINP